MTENTKRAANTFEAGGHVWTPKFTTPVIMRTCRLLGLGVQTVWAILTEVEKAFKNEEDGEAKGDVIRIGLAHLGELNIADLPRVLFLSIAHEAETLGISEEQFLESLPPSMLAVAHLVLKDAILRSLNVGDSVTVKTGGEGISPLDPGA